MLKKNFACLFDFQNEYNKVHMHIYMNSADPNSYSVFFKMITIQHADTNFVFAISPISKMPLTSLPIKRKVIHVMAQSISFLPGILHSSWENITNNKVLCWFVWAIIRHNSRTHPNGHSHQRQAQKIYKDTMIQVA